MKLYRWLALLAAAGIAGPAFGQFSSCEAGDGACAQKERDKEEEERRDKAHIEELSRIESERYEAQREHAEEL